jgi:hypothetical protein
MFNVNFNLIELDIWTRQIFSAVMRQALALSRNVRQIPSHSCHAEMCDKAKQLDSVCSFDKRLQVTASRTSDLLTGNTS